MAVADAAFGHRAADVVRQAPGEPALQVALRIERRKRPLLDGQIDRSAVRLVPHRLRHCGTEGQPLFGVVADAEHHQRAAQAQEAQADAALGHGFAALLGQRPPGHLEHVVQHAHRGADHVLESRPVEAGIGLEGPLDEPREVDGAEAAATVVGQRLLAARVRRLDHLDVPEVVLLVHAIQEDHAGVGMVVGRVHDVVHQRAGADRAVDPQSVGRALVGALLDQGRTRLCRVHQLEFGVVFDGLHECIRDADRDVEVRQAVVVLGVDELVEVGVVAAQDAHLGTAARARRLDRLAGAVEDTHVAHRPGGVRVRALDHRTAWADATEVVADAATATHGLCRLRQRLVDAGLAGHVFGDAVADRLHEAVDQRGPDVGATGRVDAAGGDEAAGQGRKEPGLPSFLLCRLFDRGERDANAVVDVFGRGLDALGVLLEQDIGRDGLRRERRIDLGKVIEFHDELLRNGSDGYPRGKACPGRHRTRRCSRTGSDALCGRRGRQVRMPARRRGRDGDPPGAWKTGGSPDAVTCARAFSKGARGPGGFVLLTLEGAAAGMLGLTSRRGRQVRQLPVGKPFFPERAWGSALERTTRGQFFREVDQVMRPGRPRLHRLTFRVRRGRSVRPGPRSR